MLSKKDIVISILLAAIVLNAYFMANAEMPSWSYVISMISIVAILVPALFALRRWLGWSGAVMVLAVLGGYAFAIETFAITYGFPYGHFAYSDELGFKVFGKTPITVFFAWTPLILCAFAICAQFISSPVYRIPAVAAALVLFDLVLDPGAVRMGFWSYQDGGIYYGVPWSNYFGWLVSGLIGAVVLEIAVLRLRPLLPVPVQLIESGFIVILMWSSFALFAGLWIPAVLGWVIVFCVALVYRGNKYEFDDMVVLVDEENVATGTARKLPVHTDNTPLHRAFSVFLFNSKGELLLQQRALEKKTWGGVWSNSCCGHVMLHEALESAAKRRLKYELGLSGIDLHTILPEFRYRAEKDGVVENEICPVLVGYSESDPDPNPDEVASFKWVAWEDFLGEVQNPDSEISPWAIEEGILLSENTEFREFYGSVRKL